MPLEALDTLGVIGWGALGLVIGGIVSILLSLLTRLIIRKRERLRLVIRHMRVAVRTFMMLLGAGIAVLITTRATNLAPEPAWRPIFVQVFTIVMIFAAALLLTSLIRSTEAAILYRDPEDTAEQTPHFRRVRTQMQIIDKVLIALVWVCALAGALLTFPAFRAVGTSLIASAGLLSIVAGLAAQSSLANIFAGMQIAFSDALRVGDLVVFKEKMGSVEEITLTYVVVRTWDDRRWIVPSNYFTNDAFENWTRREPRLLGTIEFDLDWLAPVEAMRVELLRLLHASDLWDGRSANLQVTETTGGYVRVRAVVSADTSGDLWDLRCYVREEMIHWLQRHALYALPRTRLEPETTTAPSYEEREDFVERVVDQWEQEQAADETALLPPAPTEDEDDDEGPLPKWLASWLVQRRGEEGREQPRPLEESPVEMTLSSSSPEARLYSGSPEADERSRQLSGPSRADMEEREKAAERKLKTGEQPKVEAQPSAGAKSPEPATEVEPTSSALKPAPSTERMRETRILPKVDDPS